VCPACSKHIQYPLTSGYRVFYWVLTALLAISFLDYAAASYMVLPGIAAILGLLRDARIRKESASTLEDDTH